MNARRKALTSFVFGCLLALAYHTGVAASSFPGGGSGSGGGGSGFTLTGNEINLTDQTNYYMGLGASWGGTGAKLYVAGDATNRDIYFEPGNAASGGAGDFTSKTGNGTAGSASAGTYTITTGYANSSGHGGNYSCVLGSNLLNTNAAGTWSVTGGNGTVGTVMKFRLSTGTVTNGRFVIQDTGGSSVWGVEGASSRVRFYHDGTGGGSALLGANSPASTLTAPYTWITLLSSDGSTVYVPAWK